MRSTAGSTGGPWSAGSSGGAGTSNAGTSNADTPSEFARLIQSLSPQPVNAKTAPLTGKIQPGNAPPAKPVNSGTVARPGVKSAPAAQRTQNTTAVDPPLVLPAVVPEGTRLDMPPAPEIPAVGGGVSDLGTKRDVSIRITADVSGAGETNGPPPAPKQESAVTAAPVENEPMRKTAPAKSNDNAMPPALGIAVAVPALPLPAVAMRMAASNAPPPRSPANAQPAAPQESQPLSATGPAPALEVRIRATEQAKEDSAEPVTQSPSQPEAAQPVAVPALVKTVAGQTQAEAHPQQPPQANAAGAAAQPQAAPVANPAASPVATPAAAPFVSAAGSRTERPASQPSQFYEAAAQPPGRPRRRSRRSHISRRCRSMWRRSSTGAG